MWSFVSLQILQVLIVTSCVLSECCSKPIFSRNRRSSENDQLENTANSKSNSLFRSVMVPNWMPFYKTFIDNIGEELVPEIMEVKDEIPKSSQQETREESILKSTAEEDTGDIVSQSPAFESNIEYMDLNPLNEEYTLPEEIDREHSVISNEESLISVTNSNEEDGKDGSSQTNPSEAELETSSFSESDSQQNESKEKDTNDLDISNNELINDNWGDDTGWYKETDGEVEPVSPDRIENTIQQEEDAGSGRSDASVQTAVSGGIALYFDNFNGLVGIPWFMIRELSKSAEDINSFEEDTSVETTNDLSEVQTELDRFELPNQEAIVSQEEHNNDDTVTFDEINKLLFGDDNTFESDPRLTPESLSGDANIEQNDIFDNTFELNDAPISEQDIQSYSPDIGEEISPSSDIYDSGIDNNMADTPAHYIEAGNFDNMELSHQFDDTVLKLEEDSSTDSNTIDDIYTEQNQEVPNLIDDVNTFDMNSSEGDLLSNDAPILDNDNTWDTPHDNEINPAQINDDLMTETQGNDLTGSSTSLLDELLNDEPIT